ncbi:NADPH-dependent FMN reductase [Ascidiimonas sp. W6]|uniref:NADPH-dependent FMN reductase n=1 Tax=Ascidiimonas meishanensis TaxID=3128903 RepID=UPI0030EE009D
MPKLLAFAGSNSSTSINFKLVKYACSSLSEVDINLLNLMHYPFPMYSEDLEKSSGFSNSLNELLREIKEADGLLIAVNEHNGNLSAYFKNVLDWLSRLDKTFVKDKKIFLLSTSPGKRGAIGAQEIANQLLGRMQAEIISTFSLPSFKDNFDTDKECITDKKLDDELMNSLQIFLDGLKN